jgi:hypothetical protein
MRGEHVFAEPCHACSAMPRDFTSLFRQAAILQQAAGTGTMTVANLSPATCDLSESGKGGSSRPLGAAERPWRQARGQSG